jgi:hypothetical protein
MRCVEDTPWLPEGESKARTRQHRVKAEHSSLLEIINSKQKDNYHQHLAGAPRVGDARHTICSICHVESCKRIFDRLSRP